MENEEKARELASFHAGETDYAESAAYSAAMEMAEWKDEQPKEINCGKVLQLRREAYKKGYDKAIEKACEWLKENISHYVSIEYPDWGKSELLIEKEEIITELKKAMEE